MDVHYMCTGSGLLFVPAPLMHELGTRVGFSCKTKARGVIRDNIYLLLWGGRWRGLIESKYGLLHITLHLWRTCIYPGFITIFDSSLSVYVKIECRWKGRKSKNNSLALLGTVSGCSVPFRTCKLIYSWYWYKYIPMILWADRQKQALLSSHLSFLVQTRQKIRVKEGQSEDKDLKNCCMTAQWDQMAVWTVSPYTWAHG